MVAFFRADTNSLARAASSLVGTQMETVARAELISHWIAVARECANLFNFNSAYAIVAGLSLTAVARLKQTWKRVSKPYMAKLEKLNALFATEGNYKNYRVRAFFCALVVGFCLDSR